MRKFAYILLYMALLGFVITIIVNLLHFPLMGLLAISVSFFLVLAGGIMLQVTRSEISTGPNKSKEYRVYVLMRTLGMLGAIFTLPGLLFKLIDFPAGQLLLTIGVVMSSLFFILSLFRTRPVKYK